MKRVVERQVSEEKLKKRYRFENAKDKHHRSVDMMIVREGSKSKAGSQSTSRFVSISQEDKKRHKRKVYILPHLKSFN